MVKCGYAQPLLTYINILCFTYKIDEKYVVKNYNLLFSCIIIFSPSVSGDINNVAGMYAIVKTCEVNVTTITSSLMIYTQINHQLMYLMM